MNIQTLDYRIITTNGTYFIAATTDEAARNQAAAMGLTGVLHRHTGYWEFYNDMWVQHLIDTQEVIL